MKTEIIANKLTGLTSNLVSPIPENTGQIDTIRRIIGYNLRNNQQTISASRLRGSELEFASSKEKVNEFEKYAVASLPDEDKFLVQRIAGKDIVPVVGLRAGELLLPIDPTGRPDELRWNQKRGEQIGPFFNEEGRKIWFDFYYYEDKLTVRSQNGTVPNFLFSKARKSIWLNAFNISQTVSLEAGYVWILGKLFTSNAGADEYVGFNIREGSFSLSNTKVWKGQYLDFDGQFTGKLSVKLVQPEKNAAVFEGCIAAQSIEFKYPDEVTFEWSEGKLISISCGNGEFSGYNNDLIFSSFNSSIEYEKDLNHIFIPCQSEPTTWNADFSHSQIFDSNGVAEIKKSFWSLPIVRVSNPATLGAPENNGGWGLRLSSILPARWIGLDEHQPGATLNEPLLLLYPQALFLYSKKTIIDVTFTNQITQDFSCWQLSQENSARIPLSLSYQNDFQLIYYCHAAEGEALLLGCNGQIRLDRPVLRKVLTSLWKTCSGG